MAQALTARHILFSPYSPALIFPIKSTEGGRFSVCPGTVRQLNRISCNVYHFKCDFAQFLLLCGRQVTANESTDRTFSRKCYDFSKSCDVCAKFINKVLLALRTVEK